METEYCLEREIVQFKIILQSLIQCTKKYPEEKVAVKNNYSNSIVAGGFGVMS